MLQRIPALALYPICTVLGWRNSATLNFHPAHQVLLTEIASSVLIIQQCPRTLHSFRISVIGWYGQTLLSKLEVV